MEGITINKVHGNDVSITNLLKRCNADVETMEGAAFYYCCLYHKINCVQIRSISNYVEKRDKTKWNIRLALQELELYVNKFLTDVGITVDNINRSIIVAGFYSDKTAYSVVGVFYYALTEDSLQETKAINTPFSNTYLQKFKVVSPMAFESDLIPVVARALVDGIGIGFMPIPYMIEEIKLGLVITLNLGQPLWLHKLYMMVQPGQDLDPILLDMKYQLSLFDLGGKKK